MKGLLPVVTQRANHDCTSATYFFSVALPTAKATELSPAWDISHVSGARNQSAVAGDALSVRVMGDRVAKSLSTTGNARSNTNSSAGAISVIQDIVLPAISVSGLSRRLGTDFSDASDSNGRDERVTLLLDCGYTQDRPLSTHLTHEGTCLPHFRFDLAQALQAFDSVGVGIVG